jgi:hypothetical protein
MLSLFRVTYILADEGETIPDSSSMGENQKEYYRDRTVSEFITVRTKRNCVDAVKACYPNATNIQVVPIMDLN